MSPRNPKLAVQKTNLFYRAGPSTKQQYPQIRLGLFILRGPPVIGLEDLGKTANVINRRKPIWTNYACKREQLTFTGWILFILCLVGSVENTLDVDG